MGRAIAPSAADGHAGLGLLCALTTSAAAAGGNAYVQTNLVSDQPGVAQSPTRTWSTRGALGELDHRRSGSRTTAPS